MVFREQGLRKGSGEEEAGRVCKKAVPESYPRCKRISPPHSIDPT
jgi:hypothetical protein